MPGLGKCRGGPGRNWRPRHLPLRDVVRWRGHRKAGPARRVWLCCWPGPEPPEGPARPPGAGLLPVNLRGPVTRALRGSCCRLQQQVLCCLGAPTPHFASTKVSVSALVFSLFYFILFSLFWGLGADFSLKRAFKPELIVLKVFFVGCTCCRRKRVWESWHHVRVRGLRELRALWLQEHMACAYGEGIQRLLNPGTGSEPHVWRFFLTVFLIIIFSSWNPRFGDILKFITLMILAIARTNVYAVLNMFLGEKSCLKILKCKG